LTKVKAHARRAGKLGLRQQVWAASSSGEEATMEKATERFILSQLRRHRVMTLATVRPDGYPQATIVAFAHDGITLFVAVDSDSQKVRNIRRNAKVSVAIGRDRRDWSKITGLSLAGQARVLRKADEIAWAKSRLLARFPEMEAMGAADGFKGWSFIAIVPVVISALDYTKGFGHTELIELWPPRTRR
jgi:PPOX class probable F420-dependent enzyme